MKHPKVHIEELASRAKLIRFSDIEDLFWFDEIENNPTGMGFFRNSDIVVITYKKRRNFLTDYKLKLLNQAKKELSLDKNFLELVYKAKSAARKYHLNKQGGILSMPQYAANSEKIFYKNKVGAKKITLDIAIQVGCLNGEDYADSFVSILKTVLMCQALNINLNIDLFDSDTTALKETTRSYIIVNVLRSVEKMNMKKFLVTAENEFFYFSLFNGYSVLPTGEIGIFLEERQIVEDLGDKYDIITGNMLINSSKSETIKKILKISGL